MKCSVLINNKWLVAMMRRAGALAGLGIALTLGAGLSAGAQSPNDAIVPTPYSWPNVHAGGTAPGTIPTAAIPSGVPTPNGLANFLMGTPTGVLGGKFDQISSFLLGNFDPTQPPQNSTFPNPNNFRDASPFGILSWSSPYTFTFPTPVDATLLTVDDVAGGNATYAETGGPWVNTKDGTATTGEYENTGPVSDNGVDPDVPAKNGSTATATWTLTAPADTAASKGAGFYVVTVHLPDTAAVPNDGTAPPANPPVPITDAHYIVQDTTAAKNILANVRISQTESNANQFLAGPFFLASGQAITVTLDNTTKVTPLGTVVIADSVSLQPGLGSNVESTPTAINETEFPEIQNSFYYGVASQKTLNGASLSPGTPDTVAGVPVGRGNVTVVPNPKADYTGDTAADIGHRIRQLVYYGRSENIILQDIKGNLVDANGISTTTPVIQQVGAIYCVDGFTGSVVWRYQTPAVLNASTFATTQLSREVFSSPAVARINVNVPVYSSTGPTTPPTVTYLLQTRLVVIVGDSNGLVYCLDALGNRNGTSNNSAVSVNDQPIFNPQAGLGDVTSSGPAHVGTTPLYWLYRPDPAAPRDVTNGPVHGSPATPDPTSDLPVPGSFGTASPVIYVDPTAPTDTIGTFPGDPNPSANSTGNNAAVYMGNNNGVLYKFLAAGGVATANEKFNGSLAVGDLGYLYSTQDPGRTMIPTCQPAWWMPLDGAKTIQNGSPTTGAYESIVSAPAVRAVFSPDTGPLTFVPAPTEMVYFTSANDTDNEGRLYAISGAGPTKDLAGNTLVPGTTGFNDKAVTDWEFPNRFVRPSDPDPARTKVRNALGSITGSPVVFTSLDGVFDLGTFGTGTLTPTLPTRIFFAACSGNEPNDTARPTITETGRIWSVEADLITNTVPGPPQVTTTIKYPGDVAWAFPDTLDPNGKSTTTTIGGVAVASTPEPLGAFRYVTPAIGMVQFPALVSTTYFNGTGAPPNPYKHTDQSTGRTFTLDSSQDGPVVPMLYVGSSGTGVGQQGPRFYGLDLDGANDAERTIFQDATGGPSATIPGIVSPAGNIATSAALVINSSTGTAAVKKGNGGDLYFSSGATLYQISATPVSPRDPAATDAAYPVQAVVAGTGPLSAPSVSGASVFDAVAALGGVPPATGIYSTANVTDWVYFSDSGQGIAEGITPSNQNGGIGTGLNQIVPVNPIPPQTVLSQFPLYTYEFDGSTMHLGTSTDMRNANQIGAALPLFEWGQNVYIRIGNVVPPNPGDPSNPTATMPDTSRYIFDPNTLVTPSGGGTGPDLGQAVFFTDGGPVTIQISDLDPGGNNNQPLQTDTGQVPTVLLKTPQSLPATPLSNPPGNGFFKRSDPSLQGHFIIATAASPGPPATPAEPGHTNEQLGAANTSFSSVDGININADNGWVGAYTYAIRDGSARRNTPGTTRRVVTATQVAKAYKFVRLIPNGPYTPQFIQSVTLQTTITQGGEATSTTATGARTVVAIAPVDQPTFGILNPLAAHGGAVPLFTGAGASYALGDIVGPFAGIDPSNLNQDDLPALGNGNRYPGSVNSVPVNGVTTVPNRGGRGRYGRGRIITATGEIAHASSGDNTSPTGGAAPVGSTANPVGNGGLAGQNAFGKYTLDVADRSTLGLIGLSLQNVTIQSAALRWNDNTTDAVTTDFNNGSGATVNYLPWEKLPTTAGAGANTSLDYPDIARTAMKTYLFGNKNGSGQIGNITDLPGTPDSAVIGGGANVVASRTVYADPVQMQVHVPRYQPANLQIWDNATFNSGTGGRRGPGGINTANPEFPMGYTADQQFVYVDSNHNHQYDQGEAFRTIQTWTGVPVDMTATIENKTTDLGKLPQSFGVQTDTYAPLATSATNAGFQPYNRAFWPFFKPLTVLNRGNTNWLNVHLDQKINNAPQVLPINSVALDPLVTIPAYDYPTALGGQGINGTPLANVQPYDVRSSLDPDLVMQYGRNPIIASATYNGFYPGATFHKARVGSVLPTQLRVPDYPDNAPLPLSAQSVIGSSSVPYVGMAVPLGTPVGTFAQNLRVYEGMDPGGVPYKPPTYNGSSVSGYKITGTAPSYTGATLANTNDAFVLNNGTPQQPYSTATVLRGTVKETRMTDGLSYGALPQIDAIDTVGGTYPKNVTGPGSASDRAAAADFLPSAFADPVTKDISLYWTSSRSAPAVPYNVFGVNLTKTGNAFVPTGTNWWNPIGMPATISSGPNSSINVVHDQVLPDGAGAFAVDSTAYAFVQNVTANVGAAYTDKLLCFPVTAGTGALTGNGTLVVQNTGQVINGVRGLKFKAATLPNGGFTDIVSAATPGAIKNDLWAFWYGGTRGRSAIYFTSALSGSLNFGAPAVLPIPAGLTSVSDPSAIVTYAPDTSPGANGAQLPVIEVTYTGVAPDGNADIYVSRYRPFYVQNADGTPKLDANKNNIIGLALVSAPTITEQMQADAGLLYYQARDVAWTRSTNIEVNVYGHDLGMVTNFNPPVYDRGSGTLVYTLKTGGVGVTVVNPLPNPITGSQTVTVNTVYVDLARGRVRFSPVLPTLTYTGRDPNNAAQTVPARVYPSVYATFSPNARRVTTDTRADTQPVAFLDQTYKPNDLPAGPRVEADRYWFLWRKSGAPGTSTTPTLWFKTQRLTIYLHDKNNNPVTLVPSGTLTLTDNSPNPISSGNLLANADVDWVRGRLYFPEVINGTPTEGHKIQVTFDTVASTGNQITDTIHWLDEPRTNDITLGQTTPSPSTTGGSASLATATGDAEIPMDTIINESNVSAFLDPLAYSDTSAAPTAANPDQPHKVWLFWNSTRNGTADIYYETIAPRFSPAVAP